MADHFMHQILHRVLSQTYIGLQEMYPRIRPPAYYIMKLFSCLVLIYLFLANCIFNCWLAVHRPIYSLLRGQMLGSDPDGKSQLQYIHLREKRKENMSRFHTKDRRNRTNIKKNSTRGRSELRQLSVLFCFSTLFLVNIAVFFFFFH